MRVVKTNLSVWAQGECLRKSNGNYLRQLDRTPGMEIRQAISAIIARMKNEKEMTLSTSRGIAMPYQNRSEECSWTPWKCYTTRCTTHFPRK